MRKTHHHISDLDFYLDKDKLAPMCLIRMVTTDGAQILGNRTSGQYRR